MTKDPVAPSNLDARPILFMVVAVDMVTQLRGILALRILSLAVSVCAAVICAAAPVSTLQAAEQSVTKSFEIRVDGHVLRYAATAGTIPIRNGDGEIAAQMFYVAYTVAPRPGAAPRPLTFAFNGGPGSSSSPLLLAAIGPLRVNLNLPSTSETVDSPVTLSPNDATILDRTDLVFLDAVGTGYSHAVGKASDRDFWGVDQDIDSFSKAITGWLGANDRWSSPVAIIGESYAGTRAAGLAPLLPRAGVQLRGVVLVSPGLSAPSLDLYSDTFFATLLPSYAAAAWYHGQLSPRPAELGPFLDKVSRYALGPYLVALAQGGTLDPISRRAVAEQIQSFTGLDATYVLKSNLRINLQQFRKVLLANRRLTIGELDDRQTGIDIDLNSTEPETDPASVVIRKSLSNAANDYLGRILGYVSDRPYRYNYPASQDVWDWMRRDRDNYPWVARPAYVDLATAVTRYPTIHVLTLMGYFDLASPYLQTEYDLAHMPLQSQFAENFTQRHYGSGHMMYVDPVSRLQMKADLDDFLDHHVVMPITVP